MNNLEYKHKTPKPNSSILLLVAVLVGITLIYQARTFLDDEQFMFISVPSYSIIPGILLALSIILAIKLYKIKHYQSKAYLLFALGVFCWFIAEQIWAAYDHVWEGEPFPSEADFFYIAAYPLFIGFLIVSLKPLKKSITKNVVLFSISISIALLIPTFAVTLEDMEGEREFEIGVALAYPIASAILLVPALIGILFLFKSETNISWMLLLFGFICYIIADTVFLYTILDETYYDGHPVDLFYLYSFILLIFSVIDRFRISKVHEDNSKTLFYSETIQFETISRFGIPLTVTIITLVVIITTVHSLYLSDDEYLQPESIMLGIVAILSVFVIIILTINKNLTKMVQMRTNELEDQRRNLENLVEEKTQEILKSERLSAIGELSGRLAHDLRNPLSVIKMSVDLIKQNSNNATISDTTITKRLDLIEKSIERMSHQVDDVLGFVRNSPIKLSETSLRNLAISSIAKINIPENIEIKVEDTDYKINCDSTKLDAVFINLIINAIQAMPNGGKITIRIKPSKSDVLIDFENSGEPIPNEIMNKVFDPLFTTKQTGTGLGLASCKNIVELHGGTISVQNNPTTFTIKLPKETKLK